MQYSERAVGEYGSGSAYGQGLDYAGKLKALAKLLGDPDGNVEGYALRGGVGATGKGVNPLATQLQSLYTTDNNRRSATFGQQILKADSFKQGRMGGGGMTNNATLAQQLKDQLASQAYDRAIGDKLYEDVDATPEEIAKQGELEDPTNEYWQKRVNRLTGESTFDKYRRDSGPEAGLKGNFKRNEASWDTGIGAVLGFITGGPVGAVLGAGAGYAEGSQNQKANRAQEDNQRAARIADNQLAKQNQSNATLAEQIRRRRVQRGAGEATAEYETDRPTAGQDARLIEA